MKDIIRIKTISALSNTRGSPQTTVGSEETRNSTGRDRDGRGTVGDPAGGGNAGREGGLQRPEDDEDARHLSGGRGQSQAPAQSVVPEPAARWDPQAHRRGFWGLPPPGGCAGDKCGSATSTAILRGEGPR